MLPMLAGMMAMISYGLADTYFVSRLGTLPLAAVSFTFPVNARLVGANEHEEVRRLTTHAVLLGFVAGVALVALGLMTIAPLFTMLGADETTLPLIERYMRIYYWGGIFLTTPMICNSVLRATGDARTPAMIMTASAVINIILDPILIFGLFGFPRLELEGAAIATVLANAGTLLASLSIIILRERLLTIRSKTWPMLIDSWKRILHVGLPAMTSSLIVPMTTAFITFLVAGFGQEAVAGFGLASRVEGMALLVLMSLGASVPPFIGQNFGAGKYSRFEDGVQWCYRFALIYSVAIAAVLAVSAEFIARIFTDDANAITAATWQLRIIPISYIGLGISIVVNGSFNAMGKPIAAMFVSLSRTIMVYVPLGWILSQFMGLIGIFVAGCIANFTAGGVGYFWLRTAFRSWLGSEQRQATG
jgi:putative MATE family efflux protein